MEHSYQCRRDRRTPLPQPPFQQTPSPLPSPPPLRPLSTPWGYCTCAVRPHESVRIYISIRGSIDNQSGTVLRPQNTQCNTAYVLSRQLCAQSTVATGHRCTRRSASLKGNQCEEASKTELRNGQRREVELQGSHSELDCFLLQASTAGSSDSGFETCSSQLSLRLVPHSCL